MLARILIAFTLAVSTSIAAGAKPGVTLVLITDPPNCGHCRTIDAKVLPELKRRGFSVVKDLTTPADLHVIHPRDWTREEISSLPTWILYANGREVGRMAGAREAGDVEKWLKRGKP